MTDFKIFEIDLTRKIDLVSPDQPIILDPKQIVKSIQNMAIGNIMRSTYELAKAAGIEELGIVWVINPVVGKTYCRLYYHRNIVISLDENLLPEAASVYRKYSSLLMKIVSEGFAIRRCQDILEPEFSKLAAAVKRTKDIPPDYHPFVTLDLPGQCIGFYKLVDRSDIYSFHDLLAAIDSHSLALSEVKKNELYSIFSKMIGIKNYAKSIRVKSD